jgi:D-cysteine desulfhydrase
LGGNKTRKLEFILGDALACGADTIITAGAAQSNHCRQTAAAAASLQLECHLVLGGEKPDIVNGNLLLDQIFGCHIHWAGVNRKGEDIPQIVEQLKQAGKKPYVVPYGGSNELGALAFVEALKELETQRQDTGKSFTYIVFASSSGGTQAGLMLGKKMLDASYQIVGINIDKGETDKVPFDQFILSLANSTAKFIGVNHDFSEEDLILNSDYVGGGYGVIGHLENEAISLTAQTEGILLDPVYTGRAMGGLFDMIRTGKINKKDSVLFWHTGGVPALFAYSNRLNFSKC